MGKVRQACAVMRLLLLKVNQLGDNIVFLPVVQWLERALPDCEITVATSPVAAPIYKKCTQRLKVIEFPTKKFNRAWRNPFSMLHNHRIIRRLKADACLVANDQGNVAHLLAWSSGARLRVGPRHDHLPLSRLLNERVALDTTELVAVQNWHLLRVLLKALKVDCAEMPQHPPAPDMRAMRALHPAEKPFVLIHPGASREYQRWFADRYVALANLLSAQIEIRYVLQNDAAESGLAKSVIGLKTPSLEDFTALMSQAALFIGNNSGPMHLASAFGVPGIIFSGPSSHSWEPAWHVAKFMLLRDPTLACQPCDKATGPVNLCRNLESPLACMKQWSVETVHGLALQKLGLK